MIISGGGKIYTVDEVSDLLGIPRPTLYRYLREYSIPHLRRGGRIAIPEESFDRIRKARDLHREGLGTASVRRELRETAGSPDTAEIEQRLDRLSASLEELKGSMRERRPVATGDPLPSHALRTIMARQNLLMSAVFNLSEMVEELLLASGKPRKTTLDLGEDLPVARSQASGTANELYAAKAVVAPSPSDSLPVPVANGKFGALRRRRRRGTIAMLCAVLLAAALGWALIAFGGDMIPQQRSGDRAASEAPTQDQPPAQAGPEESPGATEAASPSRTEVPDVSGANIREAARTLRESGYSVGAVSLRADESPPGTVLSTRPAPGSPAREGASIDLAVSTGPDGIQPD